MYSYGRGSISKSTPPFFPYELSFAGNSTNRPLTSGTISIKLVRTLASSVRGLRSVSTITRINARSVAATTPIPILRPHRLRSELTATGPICSSSTEKDQPKQTRRENNDTRIEERQRTHFCL